MFPLFGVLYKLESISRQMLQGISQLEVFGVDLNSTRMRDGFLKGFGKGLMPCEQELLPLLQGRLIDL